jgi:hypothetical protein
MALKSYILTQDFKSPIVRVTGIPHRPQEIRFKLFKKGDLVKGELKHANNQPAFVLVDGVLVLPVNVVREVVSKDVMSSADATITNKEETGEKAPTETKKTEVIITKPKLGYIDGIVIGAVVGVIGAYVAEKQGWIAQPDKKNKIYGAAIGAAAGIYLIYRANLPKQTTVKKVVKDKE